MTSFYFGIIIFTIIQVGQLKKYSPEVEIKDGILRGTTGTTWSGRSFMAFKGIPYAEPPIGSMRFKGSVPIKAWSGILNASTNHASCPQQRLLANDHIRFGDEDCLFLNVYTAQISEESPLPVIVFIHGGGFFSGSANVYGADILLDKDLVLVTINYRIGALGFLSMEDEIIPGNNGLKDQSLALTWVKHNIRKFGGDPEKVTIFGNSAGAASVYFHFLSSLSKDLFFAGISSSGIATASWSLAQNGEARQNAERLASFLDCPSNSSEAMLECLRKVDAYDIIKQSENFMEFLYDPAIPFKPVIERKVKGAFLTEHPVDIIKSGKLAQVPFINGITTNDGALKSAAIYNKYSLVEELNQKFEKTAPMVFHYDLQNFGSGVTAAIRKFYFKNKNIDNTTKSELTDAITDSLFYYPQRVTSELHSKYSNQPVYFYLFGYRTSVSMSNIYGDANHNYGVAHGDDLIYTLNMNFLKEYVPTQLDLKINDIMTTLLYNFANTGNPTPEINSLLPTKWEPVRSDTFLYYFIKDHENITMQENLNQERFDFWNKSQVYRELHNI